MKRKALGRGLSALIPEIEKPTKTVADAGGTATAPAKDGEGYYLCPIEQIEPTRDQPRHYFDETRLEELVQSIKEQGLIQPLVVRPVAKNRYAIIAGERRWRAAQKAGLHNIPVVIRKLDDLQAFEIALVENLQRADLNPIEEAEAYQRLLDEHSYTQDALSQRVGKDRSTVANSLRLLKLPPRAKKAVISGAVSAGHARALLSLDQARLANRALDKVVKGELSVRQTETLVRRLREGKKDQPKKKEKSANVRDLEERLTRAMKTRVRLIEGKGQSGRLEVSYASFDELDRITEQLLD
jgi:ParB family transcriptional regulator, chromosome partitioning protein